MKGKRKVCMRVLSHVQDTELVAAGFPCIDVSRAGLKRGMTGTATSLVKHIFRLLERALKDCRGVPWVLLENVSILLSTGLLYTPDLRPELDDMLHRVVLQRFVQVEGLLDRAAGSTPVVQYVVSEIERLGYHSWAQRILNTAGEITVR